MSDPSVGKGLDRVDARLKVTGQAPYAAEVPVANVAHAVIVTSTISKGKISSIDTSAAEKAPGVLKIITHLNAPKLPGAMKLTSSTDKKLQVLQDDNVLYGDQPVALVIADRLERAQYAASLVDVRYAGETATARLESRIGDAFAPKSAGPGGETDSKRGDLDAGLAAAKTKVEVTYTTPVENHNPIEPHATIAVWQGDDRVTLYDATQGIFGVQKKIAAVFDLKPDHVRVISHYVGGGFGSKGSTWSHVALAALGAKIVARPVKLVVTRQQMFSLVGHRPKTVQKLVLGSDSTGKLTAIEHDVTSETSTYDDFVEPSAVVTRMLYACPNVSTSHRLVKIDVGTPTFTRAPGEATGSFALESAMDELAYALKMDPIELRLKNYAESNPEDGKPWSSKSLRACYTQGAAKFGWSKRKAEPRTMKDGHTLIGWGMATASYPSKQSASAAVVRLRADGSVLAQAGSQDIGTGTYTVMSQIAADALGVPFERVTFELGDTNLPETPVSGGSQTASSTGSAVKMAGLELRKKLIAAAVGQSDSPLHGLAAEMIDVVDGAVVAKSDGSKRDTYAAIVTRSGQPEISADFHTEEKADRKQFSTHSFGADFVEVHVDEDLGTVRVARVVAAFAAGKILNAKTAHSQFMGGIIWGIGQALHEETVRDSRSARVVTRDLADYLVPVNADIPDLDIVSIDELDVHVNEIGAKGVGEIGITGMAAAIANAVFHATGKRIRDLPITLDKLL